MYGKYTDESQGSPTRSVVESIYRVLVTVKGRKEGLVYSRSCAGMTKCCSPRASHLSIRTAIDAYSSSTILCINLKGTRHCTEHTEYSLLVNIALSVLIVPFHLMTLLGQGSSSIGINAERISPPDPGDNVCFTACTFAALLGDDWTNNHRDSCKFLVFCFVGFASHYHELVQHP